MITIIFLILFGTVIVGFGLYHLFFTDEGRKGKSGKSERTAQKPTTGRASGVD